MPNDLSDLLLWRRRRGSSTPPEPQPSTLLLGDGTSHLLLGDGASKLKLGETNG
jgi:hypothetical protein